jgi:hypothetical protein
VSGGFLSIHLSAERRGVGDVGARQIIERVGNRLGLQLVAYRDFEALKLLNTRVTRSLV